MLLDLKSITGSNNRLLSTCGVIAGVLGFIAVTIGFSSQLFTVILFGYFQVAAAVLAFSYAHLHKLMDNVKEQEFRVPEAEKETVKEEETEDSDEGEPKHTPAEALDIFLRRDLINIIIFIGFAGILALILVLTRITAEAAVGNPLGIAVLLFSLFYLIAANWLEAEMDAVEGFKTLTYFLRAAQWLAVISGISALLKVMGFSFVDNYGSYVIAVFMALVFMEMLIYATGKFISGMPNNRAEIEMYILPALLCGSNPVDYLLRSLEEKSGISLRSAWTYGFLRRSIPLLLLVAALMAWGMTGLVQISPQEQGVVYRLGKVRDGGPLLPGLHLKMPWPIETIEVLPAYVHKVFTVGYEGEVQENFLWTTQHEGEEYKFLLGDGTELVSINMFVTYSINDPHAYLLNYSNVEETIESKAYDILLEEIVSTDLDSLLTKDRSTFSKLIAKRLQASSDELGLGLEIIDVSTSNIHPPVEIAREYQLMVSAQIIKRVRIIEALTDVASSLPQAEESRDREISNAQVEARSSLAEARSDAIKSRYRIEAYLANPQSYETWKRLEAYESAYQDRKLFLLMDDLNIWLDLRNDLEEVPR